MNIPVDMIMIIYGVDRLFDMGRACRTSPATSPARCCVTKWRARRSKSKYTIRKEKGRRAAFSFLSSYSVFLARRPRRMASRV